MEKTTSKSVMDDLMDSFYRPIKTKKEIDRKTGKEINVVVFPSVDEKKILVRIIFGVEVADVELNYQEDTLRGIIKSRLDETCPQCNGSDTDTPDNEIFKFCPLCGGSGLVSSVTKEKFLLSHLKGPR